MSEIIKTFDILDGAVTVRHNFDRRRVPYTLNAQMVDMDDVRLRLMEKYHGACVLSIEEQLAEPCDAICDTCPKSIFHAADLLKKQWEVKADALMDHTIKEGDRWEISYIFLTGKMTNHTWLFTANKTCPDGPSILEVTAQMLKDHSTDLVHGVKNHYFKIQRFDMDVAIDCSSTGHWRLIDKIKHLK